jgi:hypothetical protein
MAEPKDKPKLGILIGMGRGKSSPDAEDDGSAMEAEAKDLIAAIKDDDAAAVAASIRALISLCEDEDYDDDETA